MNTRGKMHDYQFRMIRHGLDNPYCALWAEMGLGKTVVALTIVQELVLHFTSRYCLVLAPPRVAKDVWPAEIGSWSHLDLDYRSLTGKRSARERLLTLPLATITTISVFNLEWLIEELGNDWPFDLVIIDEAHYFKSHTTDRFRAFRKVLESIERIIQLTGTPAGNGLLDLWAQVWLLDQGERLGHPYSYFRDRFFESDYMGYNWTLKDGSKEEIYQAVEDVCVSLKASDYLEMPPLIGNIVYVDLDEGTREQYKSLERDFLLVVDSVTITANSAATLTQKLQQAANGAIYDQDGQVSDLHGWKGDALRSVVLDSVGDSVLVSYAHRFQIAQIQKLFPKAVVANSKTIAAWNRGEVQVLICPWSTLGENLQAGGHIVCCFGLTWSLTQYKQLVARLWRQGQTKPVIVHHIVTRGTIDEVMVQAIKDKESNQAELLERVKLQIEEHHA